MSNVSRGSVGGCFHTFNSKPEENYSSLHFIAHSCGAGKFMTGKVDVGKTNWKLEKLLFHWVGVLTEPAGW